MNMKEKKKLIRIGTFIHQKDSLISPAYKISNVSDSGFIYVSVSGKEKLIGHINTILDSYEITNFNLFVKP